VAEWADRSVEVDKRWHSSTTDIQTFQRRDCQNYDLKEQKPVLTRVFKSVASTETGITAIIFRRDKREYVKDEINELIH
jgi:hypothetical protein